MNDRLVKLLSAAHTSLFKATRGVVGRRLVGNDMLLLTTTGRRTGRTHTVPLLYLQDADRLVVIASYGGRPQHPDWYRNLRSHPEARVQVDGTVQDVIGRTMDDGERSLWWPRIVEAYGDYETYQSRTARTIPVVALEPAR